jgi:hyperosmotically inducible periplasmic protein
MYRNLVIFTCRCILAIALLAASSPAIAQDRKPDDTAVNKQDRGPSEPTADQAKNNSADRDLTKKIRHDLVSDKSLSTYGHNVKVIVDHGKVTLKGPVHSADEKNAVEEHARKFAGDGNVVNELSVK